MKTLHLGMIIGISVIALTSLGVFIEKLNDYQQQPYIDMSITGMKENYTINDPISFSVTLEGYGTGCGDTMATITRDNDSKYQSPGWASQPQCVAHPSLHDFKFTSLSANTSINQTGNYVLTVSFDDLFEHQKTIKQKFSVFASKNTSIFDTGITPISIGVVNTNFTVNYNINQGQVSEMKLNNQTKALEILLQTTGNGTIVINLPRALIDAKLPTGQDYKYYVLVDSQESSFEELNATVTNRTLSIPFLQGAHEIEIIGAYLI